MKSTLNRIPLLKYKLLTIGELPSSYLVSMTYEEQLLWLCNFFESTLIPKMNELINTFNDTTQNLDEKFNEIIESMDELDQSVNDRINETLENVEQQLQDFMNNISNNLQEIATNLINEKIENGELIVALGLNYDEPTEALTFYINSQNTASLISELEELTTPSNEESEG